MNKDEFDKRYHQLNELEIRLEQLYWTLHRRLNDVAYTNKNAQIRDMRDLGELAEAVSSLRETRSKLLNMREIIERHQ